MQRERIRICSANLMANGCRWSKMTPLDVDASVDDVLALFATYLANRQTVRWPELQTCFEMLTEAQEDCLFVFMRRGTAEAAGILHSSKPVCTTREKRLLQQLGQPVGWDVPLWTWKESGHALTEGMERQTRDHNGPVMGIWFYR